VCESAQAECWADDDLNQALQHVQSSAGGAASLRRISVGIDHACALRRSAPRAGGGDVEGHAIEVDEVAGKAVCWGSNWLNAELAESNAGLSDTQVPKMYVGKAEARGADMIDISAGADHTCAITTHGQIQCWGHAISDTGVPTGNHWLHVRAGTRVYMHSHTRAQTQAHKHTHTYTHTHTHIHTHTHTYQVTVAHVPSAKSAEACWHAGVIPEEPTSMQLMLPPLLCCRALCTTVVRARVQQECGTTDRTCRRCSTWMARGCMCFLLTCRSS